jgi:hypothetical protein
MSQPEANLKTVTEALEALDREIADADAEVRRHSLDAALNPDGEAAAKAKAAVLHVGELHQRRTVLAAALAEAERLEAERETAKIDKERKAKSRAFAAHLGAFQKHVAEIAELQQQQQAAFARAMQAAVGASALLCPTTCDGLTNF